MFATLFRMFNSALKIHISQRTADILIQAGSYELEERGEIEMKVTRVSMFFLRRVSCVFGMLLTNVFVSMPG